MILSDAEIAEFAKLINLSPEQARLGAIFMPYAVRRQIALLKNNTRLVHYTSAESAVKIIRSKEVWMRKTVCLNDFKEVQHGLDCLYAAYKDPTSGERFKRTVEAIAPGWRAEFEQLFDTWTPWMFNDTYVTCLSEHLDHEDQTGRLSMWRAYGVGTGVALVLNLEAFKSSTDALNTVTSPVEYLREGNFKSLFDGVTKNIEENEQFLRTLDRQIFANQIFAMFRFAVLSTKHPGFAEEKEWRVIYSPAMNRSPNMRTSVEVINGLPQPVQKIPLKNIPEQGLRGVDIPEFLNRIIIGPTEYPFPAYEAFVSLLREAGVADAERKVVTSDIPLRRRF